MARSTPAQKPRGSASKTEWMLMAVAWIDAGLWGATFHGADINTEPRLDQLVVHHADWHCYLMANSAFCLFFEMSFN